MSYTSCLPAWSVGPDCYQDVFSIARRFGKTAAVIGGKTALSKAYEPLKAALAGTEFTLSQPIWYGGNSTYEHAGALEQLPEVQQADMSVPLQAGVDCAKSAQLFFFYNALIIQNGIQCGHCVAFAHHKPAALCCSKVDVGLVQVGHQVDCRKRPTRVPRLCGIDHAHTPSCFCFDANTSISRCEVQILSQMPHLFLLFLYNVKFCGLFL